MTDITAASLPRAGTEPTGWQRVWNVVRLHYTDRWSVIGLPWLIFAIIWAVNAAIWLIITVAAGRGAVTGTSWSGAVFYIFVYLGILAAITMNQTFQFALGLSVTRRDFYLGSILMFGLHALWFGAALTLLSYVEQWTDGWWLGGHLFATHYFGTGSLGQRFITLWVAILVCMFVGAAFGASFARWRMNGIVVFGAALAFVLLAAVFFVTLAHGWGGILAWVVRYGATGVGGVFLVPSALLALAGFFILRGATTKS